MKELKFPPGFWWGSATSAHQIEGDNHNDWSEWERSQKRIEELRARGLNPEDFISGRACDSYNRYEEDFDIAKQLNHNVHRLSIEWSRIEPEEGRFDDQAMQHYVGVVKSLRKRGIEPMITLWHFTNPIWFAGKGGFLNKKSPEYFTRYVKYVVDNLRDEVGLWITFNEAFTIYAAFTKLNTVWPSENRGFLSFLRMKNNMTKAHRCAYKAIKKIYDNSPAIDGKNNMLAGTATLSPSSMSHNVWVGIVENNVYVPDSNNLFRTWLRRAYKALRNNNFFKKNIPYYDFIGLNYYHMSRKPAFRDDNEAIPRQSINNEMNWELYPEGIYHVLKDLKKFKKPVIITENGIADSTDGQREGFIKDHLRWTWQAIQDGVDVRGYLYWSLLDNFEWHLGFRPKFGLVEIDYATQKRTIRPSALEYAKICITNQLEIDS